MLGQHVGRIGLGEIVDDVGGDAAVMHAAALAWRAKVSTASVNLISASASASGSMPALICGHRIVARIEAVGIDAGEIGRRGLAALADRAVGDPERRELAAGVERFDRRRAPSCRRGCGRIFRRPVARAACRRSRRRRPRRVVNLAPVGRRHRTGGLGRRRGRRLGGLADVIGRRRRTDGGVGGAMSLMLGGGRSALSGIGTAAEARPRTRQKRCWRKALAPRPGPPPCRPEGVRTAHFASDFSKIPRFKPGSWLVSDWKR